VGTGSATEHPLPLIRASRLSRLLKAAVYLALTVLVGGGAAWALNVVNASPADEPVSDIRLYAISNDVSAADLILKYSPAGTSGDDVYGPGSLWILPEFDIKFGQKIQWRIYINGPLAYADVDQWSVTWMGLKVERYGDRGTGITGWTFEEPRWLKVPYDSAWNRVYGDSGRLEIYELNVARERQRTGLGKALIHTAAVIAQLNRLPYLWAWPSPNPVSSHAGRVLFFEACEFIKFEPGDGHLLMVGDISNILSRTVSAANTEATATD
jgi:GNAT superfamily N-acetyltransferase